MATQTRLLSELVPPRAVFVDRTLLTEPVPAEVQRALQEVEILMRPIIAAALKPHGLTPYDIAAPEYRRVITEDEVPIFAALQRNTDRERNTR